MYNRNIVLFSGLLIAISISITSCASFAPQEGELSFSRSASEFEGSSSESIMEQLASDWLNSFVSIGINRKDKLDDYEIIHVEFISEEDNELVALVSFSVKPILRNSNWIAGNGVLASDSWIRNKTIFLKVTMIDDVYYLEIIGTSL